MALILPTFSALPPEIRLEIYGYLFIRPTFNLYRKPNSPDLCTANTHDLLVGAQQPVIHHTTIPTALLLACKQIHTEASTVLYSYNTFGFHDPKVLLAFLVKIGQINTGHVRNLHINVPWNQEKWVFWPTELLCRLSKVKNLRNIEIAFETISRSGLQIYGFRSHDDITSLVVGRRLSLEFNLLLALSKLPTLEIIVVWGICSEGWLECLGKRIGCKVLSRRMIDIMEDRCRQESK
jgi:hypothetical protein